MDPPGYSSQGTLLQRGDGGTPTEVFTTIPGVGDISGLDNSRDTEDATTHSSVGGYREWITTLRDGGELTAPINWIEDPDQVGLEDDFASNDARNYRLVLPLPSNPTFEFAGLVTGLSVEAPVEGILQRQLTIKVTGPITRVSP